MTSESTEDLLRQYVQDALIAKSSGSGTKLYDQLVEELNRLKKVCEQQASSPDGSDDRQLVALLTGVSRCAALLKEKYHEVLVTEILNVNLWHMRQIVREATLSFLCHVVVANGAFIQSCLHVLVYWLTPPPMAPVPDPCPGESWSPREEEVVVQDAVIGAMRRVLELVPTASPRLLPILVSNMPHKMRDRGVHCLYLRGTFAVSESQHGFGLSDGILGPVISHLIDIDVDIRWEDIVEIMTEEAKEEIKGESPRKYDEPDIFDLEGMSEGEACIAETFEPRGGWEGCCNDTVINPIPEKKESVETAAAAQEQEQRAPVNETADKMDSLMELTLEHLRRRISKGELQHVWKSLLEAFECIVLQTHRSKFTQFVMFYVASHSPIHCSKTMLHLLMNKLADRNQAPIVRSACAAYIGSFLARAAFVPEIIVFDFFNRLGDWCIKYAREEDRRGGLPPIPSASLMGNNQETISRHAAFYAACQALLYALCYHMEPLAFSQHSIGSNDGKVSNKMSPTMAMSLDGDGKSMKDCCSESLRRLFTDAMPFLLTHSLDPLSSCARSVSAEFARQAEALGHPSLASIVYKWEKDAAQSGAHRHSRPLEIFFPFDPYLLRRSAEPLNLEQHYVKWRKGHPAAVFPVEGAYGNELVVGGSSIDDDMSSDMNSDSENENESSLDLSSSSESDEVKRTRFGSMPDSSLSSGGRRFITGRLPGALKASLMAHGAAGGSPTGGIPMIHDSPSTGNNSPWGLSPASAFHPMSHTSSEYRYPK